LLVFSSMLKNKIFAYFGLKLENQKIYALETASSILMALIAKIKKDSQRGLTYIVRLKLKSSQDPLLVNRQSFNTKGNMRYF
jgi:hypothetical protein